MAVVQVEGTYGVVGGVITFTPTADLPEETEVTVTLTTGIRGTENERLADEVVIGFTTGAEALDEYTKALLHFNGEDESTTITDETGRSWTLYNDVELDTAQKKFGTASIYFSGASENYIDTPDSDDFAVAGDYTIDFWIRKISEDVVSKPLCGQCSSTKSHKAHIIELTNDHHIKWTHYLDDERSITSTGTITDTNWHHIALVRYGNTVTLYIDGTADGTRDVTGVTFYNSPYKFAVGRAGEYNAYLHQGWIDEFRFSKGIARWTANFTPPTSEY